MLLPLLLNNVQGPATQRSGVSRLWLIEYYTQEWAKKAIKTQNTVVTADKVKKIGKVLAEPSVPNVIAQKQVERLVKRAEKAIAAQLQTMQQEREKHLYVACLMEKGVKLARSEDFAAVASKMRRKLREDDELMLFSMVL